LNGGWTLFLQPAYPLALQPRRVSRHYIVYFQWTGDLELAEVSTRLLPGASKNAPIATASSTTTRSPIDELRILIERGRDQPGVRCWNANAVL
jgi:hypothetical protein